MYAFKTQKVVLRALLARASDHNSCLKKDKLKDWEGVHLDKRSFWLRASIVPYGVRRALQGSIGATMSPPSPHMTAIKLVWLVRLCLEVSYNGRGG